MTQLVGRKEEQKLIEGLLQSSKSEFLAIYGRRRVGKTFLVRETLSCRGDYFELTGSHSASMQSQLKNFNIELSKFAGIRLALPSNWQEAFKLLSEVIEQKKSKRKKIIFLDELPWLASRRSNFVPCLEYFWNTWAEKRSDILLVVCGSAASWMLKEIVNAKKGLHNRLTEIIHLKPFNLSETKEYLENKGITLNNAQVLELYMCMGGIPYYLDKVQKGRSATQNIDTICFSKHGTLYNEFDRLYSALFNSSYHYVAIIKELAKKKRGLTSPEIQKALGLTSGGRLKNYLSALKECGFIEEYVPYPNQERPKIYRLIDQYSLFYLSWIRKAPKSVIEGQSSGYWLSQSRSQSFRSWSGFTFEGICRKHIGAIKEALGIRAVLTIEGEWEYKPKTNAESGAQIDLLIDRADNVISICEMKYYNTEVSIDKSYFVELEKKMRVFLYQTGTKKQLFLVFITVHGTKENSHYLSLGANQLTIDALFV